MNETTSAASSGASLLPSTTDAFTAAHLAIIAIFAVLVILGIIYGARLKGRRKAGEREVEERQENIGGDANIASPPEAPSSQPQSQAPARAAHPAPVPPAPQQEATPAGVSPAPQATPQLTPQQDAPPVREAAAPPASAPSTAPVPAGAGADGAVTLLKGLGPKVAARLGELGITTVGQIAALDDAAAERLDAQLGTFSGRMQRDRWIEQARFLAAGDRAGFEQVFGKL